MTGDIHLFTIEHDLAFRNMMDILDLNRPEQQPWWLRLTLHEQRMFAKRWNFARLYGSTSRDILRFIRENR